MAALVNNSNPLLTDFYYDSSHEDVTTNVQNCRDKILGSYEGYQIDLNLDEFVEFFNFIGEIEKEHKCAGFWAHEEVYYFYDIEQTGPSVSWDNALKDDVIPNKINIFAGNLIIISAALFLWLFVHTGLYKKQKYEKLQEVNVATTMNNNRSVVSASRVDDDNRPGHF